MEGMPFIPVEHAEMGVSLKVGMALLIELD